MTQKEKIMEAFVAFQIIKSSAESLEEEAKDYDKLNDWIKRVTDNSFEIEKR